MGPFHLSRYRARLSGPASPRDRRSEERRVGKEWRSLCDWSSDVCSYDLTQEPLIEILRKSRALRSALLGGWILMLPAVSGSEHPKVETQTACCEQWVHFTSHDTALGCQAQRHQETEDRKSVV